jgi:hypothetical protein
LPYHKKKIAKILYQGERSLIEWQKEEQMKMEDGPEPRNLKIRMHQGG